MPKTLQRAGFRKAVKNDPGDESTWAYYVFIETFRSEICEGFDYKAVLRLLLDREDLVPDKGRPFDCRARLPGMGPTTCYRIRSTTLDAGVDE